MRKYCAPTSIDKHDLKRLRKKLGITQAELGTLANVSTVTVARWESSDKEITGPITTLLHLLINRQELAEQLEIPDPVYPLRIKYYFRHQLCTIIDVDESEQRVKIRNYQRELIYRAFGKNDTPDYEAYEAFLQSRCVPIERDKMKLFLKELDLPFYDPMLIIEKTEGRMAEDEFWLSVERSY